MSTVDEGARVPILEGLDSQWHKLLALTLRHYGVSEVVLTLEEMRAIVADEKGVNIVASEARGGVWLRLVNNAELAALGPPPVKVP